jgi:hypothetical protein
MRLQLFLLIAFPCFLIAQTNSDGNAKIEPVQSLRKSSRAQSYWNQITTAEYKEKKGEVIRIFEWFDYNDGPEFLFRQRRDYTNGDFLYDESFRKYTQEDIADLGIGMYTKVARLEGKKIVLNQEDSDGITLVYDGHSEVYNAEGQLQATIHFENGRPDELFINHYYSNGRPQFVRRITSEGIGEPYRNIGVLEAYYPDGRPFDNPITDDGTAIIILNDQGEKEDECACIDQDIMEWGRSYLYAFLGKHTILLEQIYLDEEMECCWE